MKKNERGMPKATRLRRGIALIATFVLITLVFGLGGLFFTQSFYRMKESVQSRDLAALQNICEAAVERTRRALFRYKYENLWDWNSILAYGPNQTAYTNMNDIKNDYLNRINTDTLFTNYSPDTAGGDITPEAPTDSSDPYNVWFGKNWPYQKGAYYVVVQNNVDDPGYALDPLNDTDKILRLIVTATLPNGLQRQIEARLRYDEPYFTPKSALMTDGSLDISGNSTVTGTNGDVHANVLIDVSGSANVTGKATAYSTVTVSGSAQVQGGTYPNSSEVTLPSINPESYRSLAETNGYVLEDDGTVTYYNNGIPESVLESTVAPFRYSGGQWVADGNGTPPSATYYIETDVSISGNVYMTATIIAVGNIQFSGNTSASNHITPDSGNVALLSGKDIVISGNSRIGGVVLAAEQISMTGNSHITGSVVAGNERDTLGSPIRERSLLQGGGETGGNTTIEYNTPTTTFLQVPTRVAVDQITTTQILR